MSDMISSFGERLCQNAFSRWWPERPGWVTKRMWEAGPKKAKWKPDLKKGGLLLRSQVKILSDIQGKWLDPQEEVERHHRWHHSWASFIWLRIWSSPKKSSIKPQFCLYIKDLTSSSSNGKVRLETSKELTRAEEMLNWWSADHVITRTWSQFPIPTYNRQAGSWLLSELNFQYRATKKNVIKIKGETEKQ